MNIRESDREALSQLATTRDCSVDDLVHEAIAHYLKEEAFYQRAFQGYEQYLKDGLHVTGEEVSAWIDELGENPLAPMPRCHT